MSMTISLDQETADRLDNLAERYSSSRVEILKEAVAAYDDYDRWFRARVERGLQDVRDGRVLSNEQVKENSRKLLERLRQASK